MSVFALSNQAIDQQIATLGLPSGDLLDGLKKDVVASVQIATHPGRVVIYGWYVPASTPIQPLFPGPSTPADGGHYLDYMDYSHGLRMVEDAAVLDGTRVSLTELLADPELCVLISDEGPVVSPRYQGPAPVPLAAP